MRNGWFVWCNFLCLFAVVHRHLPCGYYPAPLESLVYLVIPLFSIIAGYSWGVLLKKTGGIGLWSGLKFFVYPYFFWLVAYYLYNKVFLAVCFEHQAYSLPSVKAITCWIFNGQTIGFLYYIVSLIYLMILSIVLYKIAARARVFYFLSGVAAIGTFMIYTFVTCSVYKSFYNPIIDVFCWGVCWVAPNFFMGIVFSAFKQNVFSTIYVKWALPVLWALGIVILPFVTHTYWFRTNVCCTIILTCAMFMAMLAFPNVSVPRWVRATAPYVMGIYLVHGLFCRSIKLIILPRMGYESLVFPFDWLTSIIVVLIAWGLVWLIRRIPVMRAVV